MISESEVQSFLGGLHHHLQFAHKLRQQANALLADDFNTFDYMDVSERKLSWMTAELLRPTGKHGQGDIFLQAFLRTVNARHGTESVRVSTEAPTRFTKRARWIDIKLHWSDFVIGIENKPFWAPDQEEQVDDYIRELDKESPGQFVLFYLSPNGSDPSESSISKEELARWKKLERIRVLNYPEIMCCWLRECIDHCRAERVRSFLREFRDYLLREFPQEKTEGQDMTGLDDLILSYAFQCDDHIEVAIAVGERFGLIKQSVIGKFAEALQCELERRLPGVEVFENQLGTLKKDSGFYFCKPEWRKQFSIGVAADQPDACSMYFGLAKQTPQPGRLLGDTAAKLDEVLGRGKTTDDWEWKKSLDEPYKSWNSERLLLDMYKGKNGEALDCIASFLVRVFQCVEQDVDKAVSDTLSTSPAQ